MKVYSGCRTFKPPALMPHFSTGVYKARLTDANAFMATPRELELYSADLSGADLSGANLSKADLSGANLSKADLSGANLTNAYLPGANLSEAELTGVIGADFAEAIGWER